MSIDQQSNNKGIKVTVILLLLFVALVVGLFAFKQVRSSQMGLSIEDLRQRGVFIFETPRLVKPFSLRNHKGETFEKDGFQDKWSLVFFGFTTCPDICPTTLAFLNQMVKAIDTPEIKHKTQVVMVSVDPARDTVDKLNQYVPYFNPEFIGITGEFIDIFRFASNLNAPFQKVTGDNDDYTVDHSGYVFIVNPKGDYQGFMKPPFDVDTFILHFRSVIALNADL